MVYADRKLAFVVEKAARHFPALVMTGPRRAVKTTILRRAFPQVGCILLDDTDMQAQVRSDPRAFLEALDIQEFTSILNRKQD